MASRNKVTLAALSNRIDELEEALQEVADDLALTDDIILNDEDCIMNRLHALAHPHAGGRFPRLRRLLSILSGYGLVVAALDYIRYGRRIDD